MSDALSYTRGTRIARLLGARYYLNNYFAMYTRLTCSRIQVEHASPACLRVRNYLNNYFANYTRVKHSHICVEFALPAYWLLGII